MAVVFAAVCVLAASAQADVLYQSRFAELPNGPAQPADWSLAGAHYAIEDGWLTVRSEQSNPLARLGVAHSGDCTFRATVRNARECHWVAVLARGVYRLEVNNQFVQLRLLRHAGDEWQVVAEAGDYAAYSHNTQAYELRLVVAEGKAYGFIDDKLLVEYADPDPVPEGGDFALLSGWGTDCAWRDVSLTDEPDLSEWPVEVAPRRAPEGLVEVTQVRGRRADSIYFDGERPGLAYRLRNPGTVAVELALSHRLVNIWQETVDRIEAQATLDPGEEQNLVAEFPPPPRGCFKVALYAARAGGEPAWVEDLGSFTALPHAVYDAPRNADSYFGGHMDGINLEWHLQAGRKLGIQWARCHDALQTAWWERIQPDGPDEWQWPYDEAQQRLDALGFMTLGEFCKTPTWASSAKPGDPGHPREYPPQDWEAYARYVRETVTHYKGSIRNWEVWNEPHYAGFWRGTPEDYAKLLEVTYREAKQADPDCFVLGGGGVWPRDLDWIERVLRAGGAQHMDGFSIHYLEPDIARDLVPRLRALLSEHGFEGPIWNTEANVPSSSLLDQLRAGRMEPEARYHFRNACCELVRMVMENLACGIDRVFHYAQVDPWRTGEFPKPRVFDEAPIEGGMWDEGRMLKPLGAAHAALSLAIEGKRFVRRIERGDLQAFIFEGQNAATAVQYATYDSFLRREEVVLTVPDGARAEGFAVIDVMGSAYRPPVVDDRLSLLLAREPVYVVYFGEHPAEVLQRLYSD